MEEKRKKDIIDLREVASKVWASKKLFYKVWGVTFVLACAWILPVPRTYMAEVRLAPEAESGATGGALGSLASNFGIDLGAMPSTDDAIQPLLYPQLFESNEFIVSLFDIRVQNDEGDIETTYYDYIANYQKQTFYLIPFKWVKRQIKKMFSPKVILGGDHDGKKDPFNLSEYDSGIVEGIKQNINCSVDKQYFVITLNVTDQDRKICATMADSVRVRLQNFITDYRTHKARIDVEYYERLTEEARVDYEDALNRYSEFCDANRNSILQSYISKRDYLENDMQLKFNTYSAMQTQLQSSQAKVQERTPAFTVLTSATMPIRPAGPKRMLFVLGMLILASLGTGGYVLKDNIFEPFK